MLITGYIKKIMKAMFPSGLIFILFKDSNFDKLIEALSLEPERIKTFYDDIYLDLFQDLKENSWMNDLVGETGTKVENWQDELDDSTFNALIEYSTQTTSKSLAKLFLNGDASFGKILTPQLVVNLNDYDIVEFIVDSIGANTEYNLGIQELEGAFRHWFFQTGITTPGTFSFGIKAMTDLRDISIFSLEFIVVTTTTPSTANYFEMESLRIYKNNYIDSIEIKKIEEWEKILGITDDGLTTANTRKTRAISQFSAQGVQSPEGIETVLRNAGFDIRVYELIPAEDPRENINYISTCGDGISFCQDFLPYNERCGFFGEVLINAGNIVPPIASAIPSIGTSSTWPFYWYIAGDTFIETARIPITRKAEFQKLVGIIKPAHTYVMLKVNYTFI